MKHWPEFNLTKLGLETALTLFTSKAFESDWKRRTVWQYGILPKQGQIGGKWRLKQ